MAEAAIDGPDQRARLAAWLGARLDSPVAIRAMARMSGGAIQENWSLQLDVGGTATELVLRTDAASVVAASAGREEEFRVLAHAWRAGVTVPEPIGFCADRGVIGRPFAVARRVEGIADPRRLTRDEALIPDRESLGEALGAELARIHAIRPPIADLDFLPLSNGVPAQARIGRYRRWLDALAHPQPAIEWALRRLELHAPAAETVTLVHGDYRTGNLMIDAGRLTSVLDWEFAGWGDPMEDIGWFCARCWRFARPDREGGGLASRAAFYRGYERQAGHTIRETAVPFWEAMATLRWAIIALQQGERYRAEATPTLEPAMTGRLAPQLALDALDQVDAIAPLAEPQDAR
jgi:aminoglycoside phosphotransferase (APT) family kinase protein